MRLISVFLAMLLLSGAAAAQKAHVAIVEGEDMARQIVVQSLREDVAADDARVAKARAWLDKAVKASGEPERAVAAACERTARYFFDLTKTRASALEMLEALAAYGRPGRPMQETFSDYIKARRQAAGMSHAAAMTAMAGAR
jgi:fructose-specific component phosphotransferase system IIB-like protein